MTQIFSTNLSPKMVWLLNHLDHTVTVLGGVDLIPGKARSITEAQFADATVQDGLAKQYLTAYSAQPADLPSASKISGISLAHDPNVGMTTEQLKAHLALQKSTGYNVTGTALGQGDNQPPGIVASALGREVDTEPTPVEPEAKVEDLGSESSEAVAPTPKAKKAAKAE